MLLYSEENGCSDPNLAVILYSDASVVTLYSSDVILYSDPSNSLYSDAVKGLLILYSEPL
jgi:uncharacterized protein YqiB (DUF1249 family)